MADTFTIQKVSEETELQVDGPPKAIVRVAFKVGTDGPFSKVYERAAFNSSTVRRDLEDFARELAELRRT